MPLFVFEFQPTRQHVREARTVAVLAADRQFGKWRTGKLTVALREGIGTPAVTRDAAGQDRPIEPGVAELVSRRQLPALCLGVKRQRRLKYIIALPDKASEPVLSDRKSTRLNSSHANISYAVFCLKKKTTHARTCTFPLLLRHPIDNTQTYARRSSMPGSA